MNQHIHGGDIYRNPNVLDFSANINPLGTPDSVIAAAAKSLEQIAHYPDVQRQELTRALADYEGVSQEAIICGNGAAELIFAAVWALKPGKALVTAPAFAEYEQALDSAGCQTEHYYLKASDGFAVTEDILDAITGDLDVFFLCNPNNPTGVTVDSGILDSIIKQCAQKQVFLILDECFVDFLDDPGAATKKDKLEAYPNLFLLKAFTKRYAMAGLRLGYGLCKNQMFLAKMRRMMQPWSVSTPAQAAGVAALLEEDYVERARVLIHREREVLKEAFGKLGLNVFDSSANYIFFRGRPGLRAELLEQGVMIRDCGNYPGLSEGYYRIAVRRPEENQKLLQALKMCLAER